MSATAPPRIEPGGRREIGLVNTAIVRVAGLAVGGDAPHVFTTLARNRGLFRRWLFFAGGLMPGGKLPRVDTELVILRVAHNSGCDYEWDHHARLGRRAGLTAEQVEGARAGVAADVWTPRQELLLRACDELHADGVVGDELWAGISRELSERDLIELLLLVGHYEMLAMTLRSLRVAPDPVAAEPRGLRARLMALVERAAG